VRGCFVNTRGVVACGCRSGRNVFDAFRKCSLPSPSLTLAVIVVRGRGERTVLECDTFVFALTRTLRRIRQKIELNGLQKSGSAPNVLIRAVGLLLER
jgi:hypothetical protein